MQLALCGLNEIEQEPRKLSRSAIFAHLHRLIAATAPPLADLLGVERTAAKD